MATPEPVTVVLIGPDPTVPGGRPDVAADLGALPGVRLLARTDDPRRAPRLVHAARPDVVLAGLGRDRDAVLAVVPEVTARAPDAPVLAVSGAAGASRTDPTADVLAAVRAGATGYLVAAGDPAALADAVRRTAAREPVFSPGLAEVVLDERGRAADATRARLTPREADVLRLVVDGLTARQIATRLVLSPRTVENHVQRVLHRIGVPNRAALVRYAIEHGLA
jgi:DNA-binding NarL/FixJ family response regulator